MKKIITTAIIAEYNPFHNGHKYQIEQARNITGADLVVVVMSGNFVQRGQPAIINKWTRAEMALRGGADLVLELPLPFAVSSAEYFATGSVKILNMIGTVDYLCFGSELGEIETLKLVAQELIDESTEFKTTLRTSLDLGYSYPTARASALTKKYHAIAKSPNNILGIEYIKALIKSKSKITPVTIKRLGSDYNSTTLEEGFSSATAIRTTLFKDNSLEAIADFVPDFTLDILKNEFVSKRGPVSNNKVFENLRFKVRTLKATEIAEFPGVSEGLENKIMKVFESATSFDDAVDSIKSKRFPATRISRALLSIYLNINKKTMHKFLDKGPTYLRILGFRKSAQPFMRELSDKKGEIVGVKLKKFVDSKNKSVSNLAKLETLSTDLFVLNYPDGSEFINSGQEFTTNPIILP